jgi:FdhD protein
MVRIDDTGARTATTDAIVDEAALVVAARGTPVATIMRTPGHDLELVRGLLHAEGIPITPATAPPAQTDVDRVTVDVDPSAFAGRGLLATAACGVCGREVIADLELRAREVASDLIVPAARIAALPAALRAAQDVFAATGGLHAAGAFDPAGRLVAIREDVGRHNAVDKLVGWLLDQPTIDRGRLVLMLSGRLGFELVHKAVMAGIPIVAAVSAPTTLAIDVAERFGVAACGFVRDGRVNVYSHRWRLEA